MIRVDIYDEMYSLGEKTNEGVDMLSKKPLCEKFEENFPGRRKDNENLSHFTGSWCEAVSSFSSNVTGKLGTGKLSQTFNNVKATFGVLSQRIKKSTKKRQTLINIESPCSKSRAALGRTPTKLYSPFSIDTPTGKENQSNRFIQEQSQLCCENVKGDKKKLRRTRLNLNFNTAERSKDVGDSVISNDLLQTQLIAKSGATPSPLVLSTFNNSCQSCSRLDSALGTNHRKNSQLQGWTHYLITENQIKLQQQQQLKPLSPYFRPFFSSYLETKTKLN